MARSPIVQARLLAIAVCLVVTACGPELGSTSPASSPGPTSPSGSSLPAASAGASIAPSAEPPSAGPSASPAASPEVSASPAASPETSPGPSASAVASPSAGAGPADACSGTADNRDFFASLAASVAWDVYCAVLPAHWNVAEGSYRLASGGRLEITYKGPGGARITLREGAFCDSLATCPPAGADSGPARFGALDAHLFVDSDGTSTVFAQDEPTAWEAVGAGMDAATLSSLAAALARVGP